MNGWRFGQRKKLRSNKLAHSYRDRPRRITAEINFPRDKRGIMIFPKVVQRKPPKGDVYPFEVKHIRAVMRSLPKEYLYGLKQIELRPRANLKRIGDPFGVYWGDEKKIILFSVPEKEWLFEKLSDDFKNYYEFLSAIVSENGPHSVKVVWREKRDLAYFYFLVLMHEIGHHIESQYSTKKKPSRKKSTGEMQAHRHSGLLADKGLFKAWNIVERVFDKQEPLKEDWFLKMSDKFRHMFSEWR